VRQEVITNRLDSPNRLADVIFVFKESGTTSLAAIGEPDGLYNSQRPQAGIENAEVRS
jgi:hypothetical protein